MRGRGFANNPNFRIHVTIDAGVGADIIRPLPPSKVPIRGISRRALYLDQTAFSVDYGLSPSS